ncbi:MAG: acyl carrier protein [Bryobacteraceae bacterium]
MDNTQLRSRVTDTFRNVFGEPDLAIWDDMTAEDVEQWDSLTHINLIVALEREFRVKFTTGEVSKLKNVGDLVSLIQAKTS